MLHEHAARIDAAIDGLVAVEPHALTRFQSACREYDVSRCSTTVLPSSPAGNDVGATRAYVWSAASTAIAAGTYCVSIWNALLASEGRESSSMPANSGWTSTERDQKYGVKNATGPFEGAAVDEQRPTLVAGVGLGFGER